MFFPFLMMIIDNWRTVSNWHQLADKAEQQAFYIAVIFILKNARHE